MASNNDEFLGDKIRAGRILSSALRRIMQEKTELIQDPENGDRMGTKAEALMRVWVKYALGFTEEVPIYNEEHKLTGYKTIIHTPDRIYGQLIADRIEGRVATTVEHENTRPTAAKKVSDLNKNRLNRIAKDTDASE